MVKGGGGGEEGVRTLVALGVFELLVGGFIPAPATFTVTVVAVRDLSSIIIHRHDPSSFIYHSGHNSNGNTPTVSEQDRTRTCMHTCYVHTSKPQRKQHTATIATAS